MGGNETKLYLLKTVYQSELKGFTDLVSPPVVAVNRDNHNVMGKEKMVHNKRFDNIGFGKYTMTKWKSNLKSIMKIGV